MGVTKKPTDREAGFASIVIALTIIVVLALLTVGFAQLSRREQQTALNKQLSNQAYYAAESGINDAVQDINSKAICDNTIFSCTPPYTSPNPTNCMTSTTGLTSKPSINNTSGVGYSCLLVDLKPASLSFGGTPTGGGQQLYFSTNPAPDSLTVTWSSDDSQNTPKASDPRGSVTAFPSQASWGKSPAVLLFSLTKVTNPAGLSRSNLINNTFNIFLYPSTKNDGPALFSDPQGEIMPGNCTAAGTCSVTISGLGGLNSNYILHYISYYDSSNVTVTATNNVLGTVKFIGQDVIDVTGQAHNVLKRLQERFVANPVDGSITTAQVKANDSVQAQNLCKRLQTLPSPGTTDFISATSGSSNPLTIPTTDPCYLNN